MTEIFYFCHPVNPRGTETVESNLHEAAELLKALQRANPGVVISSQWLLELMIGIDRDQIPRERTEGIGRCIDLATCGAFTGIIVGGQRIGAGSFAELRGVCATGRQNRLDTIIHRVRHVSSAGVLPRREHCQPIHMLSDFEVRPYWLEYSAIGAAPMGSSSLALAEIQEAADRARR